MISDKSFFADTILSKSDQIVKTVLSKAPERIMSQLDQTFRRRRKLDRLLRSIAGFTNATQFAITHGVDPRTVRNDLEWLFEHGGKIITRGRTKWYADSDCSSPFALSEEETMAFLLGHTALMQYGGTAFGKEAESLYAFLTESVIDKELIPLAGAAAEAVRFRKGRIISGLKRETVHSLINAYLSRNKVRVSYQKPVSANESGRVLHPYCFVNEGGEWSMVAYCESKKSVQRFVMARINAIELLKEPYEIADDFDANDFLNQGFDNWCDGESHRFKIRFSPIAADHVSTREIHETQIVTFESDGSCIVEFESEGLPAVARWVMQFGREAFVIKPKKLAKFIEDECQAVVERYSGSL